MIAKKKTSDCKKTEGAPPMASPDSASGFPVIMSNVLISSHGMLWKYYKYQAIMGSILLGGLSTLENWMFIMFTLKT